MTKGNTMDNNLSNLTFFHCIITFNILFKFFPLKMMFKIEHVNLSTVYCTLGYNQIKVKIKFCTSF